MKYQRISMVIQEAHNLNALVENLLMCIDGVNRDQRRQLIKDLTLKLKEINKKEKEVKKSSHRSIHSERLAAMGQMAAAISHELRNPLSGIKVASEYLIRRLKEQPEIADIIINIHNEVIFANNIISNILEHARISKPNFERSSIKKLIEEAILTIAQQGAFNNIEIKRKISDGLPLLNFDPLQLRQVFVNLFINSSEAMVGGGSLEIIAYHRRDSITIKVIDTGCGIEKSHLEKLFEPFFSTKVKGIGLGLAIAKEIIDNHKGQIDVESKLGKGTTFTITLPLPKR